QLPGHHLLRRFLPPLRLPPGLRNRHQLRARIPKIGISPPRRGIHPARSQRLSRGPARNPPLRLHLQVASPYFRRRLNKSRLELLFLLPERRRRHDFLRMNPTEIPLKSPASVTDLSIGEVEQ